MSALAVLGCRPRTGSTARDRSRDAKHLAAEREFWDRKFVRPKLLGKLRVFPDQLPQATTANLSDSPSEFWARAEGARKANGGDALTEKEWAGQTRAFRGASARATGREYATTGDQLVRRNAAHLRERLRATHPLERCACCGWSAIGAVGVSRRDDGRLVLASVASCGSVWCCPSCALIIKGERAEEIKEGTALHDMHFGPDARAMLTLTIRHEAGQSLREIAEGYQLAWNQFRTRVPTNDKIARKAARKSGATKPGTIWERMGYVGSVYGAETTHGGHGWHYHRHVLLQFDRTVSKEELKEFRDELSLWWAECVSDQMGPKHVPDFDRACRLTRGKSDYLAKLGLEIADVGTKKAKNGNRTVWGLGEDAANGDGEALDFWIEYCEATKAKKAIQLSDSLIKHWKRLGWKPAAPDGDLVDESKGAQLLLEVTGDEWKLWRQSGRVMCDLVLGLPAIQKRLSTYAHQIERGWGAGLRVEAESCDRTDSAERYAIDLEAGRRGMTRQEIRDQKMAELERWREVTDGAPSTDDLLELLDKWEKDSEQWSDLQALQKWKQQLARREEHERDNQYSDSGGTRRSNRVTREDRGDEPRHGSQVRRRTHDGVAHRESDERSARLLRSDAHPEGTTRLGSGADEIGEIQKSRRRGSDLQEDLRERDRGSQLGLFGRRKEAQAPIGGTRWNGDAIFATQGRRVTPGN